MSLDIIRREIARGLAGTRQAFRGVIGSVDKTKRVQLVNLEGLNGEALQAVELFQHFGFTSAPPAGAQVIVLPLGGRTSAAVLIATENGSYRLQLGADGEVAIYNQWGDHVWLKQGGVMEVVSSTKVAITSPLVTMSGDLHVAGNITADKDIADQGGIKTMAGMRTAHNNHEHPDPQGGTVGLPTVLM